MAIARVEGRPHRCAEVDVAGRELIVAGHDGHLFGEPELVRSPSQQPVQQRSLDDRQ